MLCLLRLRYSAVIEDNKIKVCCCATVCDRATQCMIFEPVELLHFGGTASSTLHTHFCKL